MHNLLHRPKQLLKRALVTPVRERLAQRTLAGYVRDFRNGHAPNHDALAGIRRAWGNEGFSADASYLREAIALCGRVQGPVLECGSGLTTLVAALIAEQRGEVLWSLEQDGAWAQMVGHRLAAHGITNVELVVAALKDYGDFVWYDLSGVSLPARFGLVLCDGPAVFPSWGASHQQWRYGLLPVLGDRRVDIEAILLDDADEPRAARLLQRWTQEFAMDADMLHSSAGTCALLRGRAAAH